MFLPELTPDDLRQGDILSPLVFPRWDLNNYQLSGKVEEDSRANLAVTDVMMLDHIAAEGSVMKVLRNSIPLRSMICSHDCEFDKAEAKNRAGIIVAPLMQPPDIGEEEMAKLRASFRRSDEREYEFIHLFPLDMPDIGFFVADFSAMMAVGPPSKIKKRLIGMRELEMTDEGRSLLRYKLAAFFSRPDEPDQEGERATASESQV